MKSNLHSSRLLLKSALLFLSACLLLTSAYAVEENEKAPDFTLKSRSGENLKLSEFRGELVMVNFWASWCGPCRQEMPELESLYQQYKGMGFTLLGINVDDQIKNADKMLKQIPVSFPVLYDSEHKVSDLYEVAAMPTTILIDRNGTIRDIHHGYQPGTEQLYQKQIEALLTE
ncbi:MAG: TlpA family protein disulfide reductase [Candidatus Polarisedimenticolaceae bacterium]|nr:TlpA family protein disulfide reductase [Candidatus Polarisedimenticolaceae bacterium]